MQIYGLCRSLPCRLLYEGENMLVIHPDECTTGVCEPECPAEAITDDSDDTSKEWIEINRKYAEIWPNINKIGTSDDRDNWKDVKNKYKDHFSPNPGKGT